jgi:hypothetical protein
MNRDARPSEHRRPDPQSFKDLHPVVYRALGVAVLWFVLAVWEFSGQGDADYLLAIVSGFFIVAIAIPSILWHVGKVKDVRRSAHENDAFHDNTRSFRDWASADFVTWQDRLQGSNAAIEALLPIATAAFGMTVFGIIFHIAAHNPIHYAG